MEVLHVVVVQALVKVLDPLLVLLFENEQQLLRPVVVAVFVGSVDEHVDLLVTEFHGLSPVNSLPWPVLVVSR